jgi:quercetin dioxygenase-like cupin family protein
MSEVGFRVIRFGDVPWEPRTEDEWPCLVKRQLIDAERNLTMRIVWYARGAVEPRHVHGGSHAAFVMLGSVEIDGETRGPWDAVYGPGDYPHGPLLYRYGCMLFATLSGSAFHQRTDADASSANSRGLPTQIISSEEIPWRSAAENEDGWPCERKLILDDPARNYAAGFERWPRGSTEPRHVHDYTHASMILQGKAIIDGQEYGPWDLIYGPSGVPHGQISYPEGAVLAVSSTQARMVNRPVD